MVAFLAIRLVRLFHELIFTKQTRGTLATHETTWMPVLFQGRHGLTRQLLLTAWTCIAHPAGTRSESS